MTSRTAPAWLSELVDGIQSQSEESCVYFDRWTGRVVLVMDETTRMIEDGEPLEEYPEWQQEMIQEARAVLDDEEGRFVQLPDQWEIHEYRIMEDFCDTLEAPGQATAC